MAKYNPYVSWTLSARWWLVANTALLFARLVPRKYIAPRKLQRKENGNNRGTLPELLLLGITSGYSSPPAPSTQHLSLLCSSLSLRPRSSYSHLSFCAPNSTVLFGAFFPTIVVEGTASTARLHLLPARRPRISKQYFPSLSFRTSGRGIFC